MEPPTESMGDLAVNTDSEDVVDPWNVTSASEKGVDYDKLIGEFTVKQPFYQGNRNVSFSNSCLLSWMYTTVR